MPEQSIFLNFSKRIDRRSPRSSGDAEAPVLRENLLSRDNTLTSILGTEEAITNAFDARPTWGARYYSVETGAANKISIVYTQDGNLWRINEQAKTAIKIKEGLNTNAYPRHWLFKTQTQTKLYLVDGKDLYVYDGNLDYSFAKVPITNTGGDPINPIDLIEHKDRLILISKIFIFVSANLKPEIFDDATDSIQLIAGSGKGENLAVGKIEDNFYAFNTEGIFTIVGDVISAVASTFELRLVDEKKIAIGRSLVKVEKALLFIAEDLELWSWDGNTTKMLSYDENLKTLLNPYRDMLDKGSAVYHNNYYQLSVVRTGDADANFEIFWDAFESKIDFVVGRNVSYYLPFDATKELGFMQMTRSDANKIVWADRTNKFDGTNIRFKLRTRDITIANGQNVRISAFRPKIKPQNFSIVIRYLLDGRLSSPTGSNPVFSQSLVGETKTLGFIEIGNQTQFSDRIRPKINHARGESIAFEINDNTANLKFELISLGIDFIFKSKKKNKKVGG